MPAPVDPQIKGRALAELATGSPLKTTARKFGVSHQTLRQWRDAAGLDPVLTPAHRADVGAALDRYICKIIEGLGVQFDYLLAANWFKDHGIDEYLKLLRAHQETVARVVEAQAPEAEDEQPTPIRRAI